MESPQAKPTGGTQTRTTHERCRWILGKASTSLINAMSNTNPYEREGLVGEAQYWLSARQDLLNAEAETEACSWQGGGSN